MNRSWRELCTCLPQGGEALDQMIDEGADGRQQTAA